MTRAHTCRASSRSIAINQTKNATDHLYASDSQSTVPPVIRIKSGRRSTTGANRHVVPQLVAFACLEPVSQPEREGQRLIVDVRYHAAATFFLFQCQVALIAVAQFSRQVPGWRQFNIDAGHQLIAD